MNSWIKNAKDEFDFVKFRARLCGAIWYEEITWNELCRRAGLPPVGASDAVKRCATDFVPEIDILEKLAAPLGRTAEWLLTGRSADNEIVVGLRERTRALVEEFGSCQELQREDICRLHNYVDRKFQNLQTQTPQAAFRRGIPETLRDVAWIYEEMLQLQG